jgi:predicted NAD/FAD-dependent oxidoreductase
VGGSDGGRNWLLQLMGQAAAQQHGAHVLKVRDLGLQVSGGIGGRTNSAVLQVCCRDLAAQYMMSSGQHSHGYAMH